MKKVSRSENIYNILKKFVFIKSRTGTKDENLASNYIYDFIKNLEYFKQNPENCGLIKIENDPFERYVPFAFVEGKSKNTVILSGHFDVVDEFDYGDIKELAYEIGEELENALKKFTMNDIQQAAMESGNWIWGKGAADMKGGLAIHMDILEEFSTKALEGNLEGSILFLPVPDEESYSMGMRTGAKILADIKAKKDLDYKLLINPEPTDTLGEKQIMYLGSVGKLMPVVMVQGVSCHIGHHFDGFSPLNILSGIYSRTNSSLDFVDKYDKEATMPPTWIKMRDLKDTYDVSIPLRAGGYFTVLSLNSSPKMTLDKVLAIAKSVCQEEIDKAEDNYTKFKYINMFENRESLGFKPEVYDFRSLRDRLKEVRGADFESFYEEAYKKVEQEIDEGKLNYPDGTMKLMEMVMDFANFTEPVVVVGFAPPYYPAVNGNEIEGKEGATLKAFNIVKEESAKLGVEMTYQNYFMGISDNSYSAVDKNAGDLDLFQMETPLWGDCYNIDFKSISQVNVPAIIYGPVGKEYHKWSERVEKNSLLHVVPTVTRELIKQAWDF